MLFVVAILAIAASTFFLWRNQTKNHLKLMSSLTDYITKATAFQTQQSAAVDGLIGDVAELNRQIAALVASQGTPSPEDQAALDALVTQGQTIADKLTALDAQTPPATPPSA